MVKNEAVDYYEVLQVSVNAEPETVHRVYRMLAQRYHPDNVETGDENRFRLLTEAYQTISDPEQRVRYDVRYQQAREDRWRIASEGVELRSGFEHARVIRNIVLEVLYTRRRLEPSKPGIFVMDLEKLTGTPREHLEFTVWYLAQKNLVQRTDNSMLAITADGVEYLEENHHENGRKRLVTQNE
jgi:curved DNA-binding protein CbpA